tara:strand:- start:9045 stop:11441 length:2397 start_codon:yes stop_codon:yes gene_type:complete
MNISYKWLNDLLDFNLSVEETSDLLTDIGLEVEKTLNYINPLTDLSKLLVGEVIECYKHPNADRLKLTKVDIGLKNNLNIICGAPNVEVGQKVVIAPVGCKLTTINNESFKIKKSKIRGIESEGMICAEDEIGVGNDHEGIIVLKDKCKVGDSVDKVFKKFKDHIFEIGLTPNRCDAMSHYGVARDLRAALSYRKGSKNELILPSILNFTNLRLAPSITIDINDSNLCNRFCGVIIKDLKIQPSKKKIVNRLNSIGLNSINNVVDITNLVMHELGQPLHAYDLDKIKSAKIEIKRLKSGTKFTTLDGDEINLHEDDLMVCDGNTPMCIAGVYGGKNHGVSNTTSTIFLESAFFNPISVRKTSKRHNINTDSSYRFERGVDIDMVEYALKRAAALILENCEGEIICDIIDEYPNKTQDKNVVINFEKINSLIGYEIDKLKIKSILNLLDFKINNVNDISAGVTIPHYRHDVERECDVVEEILRIHGYNNIPEDEHAKFSISNLSNSSHKYQNIISDYLSSVGFNEIMNNSLVPENLNSKQKNQIFLKNSLSKDISIMRPNLLDGFLNSIAYNLNRKSNSNNMYEFGSIYHKSGAKYIEKKVLGIALNGNIISKTWRNKVIKSDLFILKNIVLNLLNRFDLNPSEEISNSGDLILKIKGKLLATIEKVNIEKLKNAGIKSDVYFSNIDLNLMYSLIKEEFFEVKPVSKYPTVVRDFSFLIDNNVLFEDIKYTILSISPELITSVALTDSYIPEKTSSKTSYSFTVSISSVKKTMSDKEIKYISQKIIKSVSKEHNAVLRD